MITDVDAPVLYTHPRQEFGSTSAHIQWADVESPDATTSTTTPQDERTEMERRPVLCTATDSQNLPINVPKEGLKLVPGAVGDTSTCRGFRSVCQECFETLPINVCKS